LYSYRALRDQLLAKGLDIIGKFSLGGLILVDHLNLLAESRRDSHTNIIYGTMANLLKHFKLLILNKWYHLDEIWNVVINKA